MRDLTSGKSRPREGRETPAGARHGQRPAVGMSLGVLEAGRAQRSLEVVSEGEGGLG